MSKRCIRPLVAADVALSSRLPAPGAGAENAAIRTGDRMVPPAAHSESLPPGCRSSFRPRRRAICTVSVDDRPLPASARTGGRRAPPRLPPGCRSALRLPPFAVRTAFAAPPFGASRRADMIRRSTLASGFRSGAAKSDTRFASAEGRCAPSRLTTDVCPLPLGRGARGSASPASGLPFCASVVAFRGSEPDSAFFPTVRRLDRRRPAGGRIMNNKKSTFKQLF